MTAIEAIMKRRSIRKFTQEPVTKETAMQLVDAAAAAPSAMNLRPVRFILMDKHDMAKLAETIDQKQPFEQGRWAIAVCADTRGYTGGTGWLEDSAAALENIQIAATALGLGALWYGVYRRAAKEPQVRAALNLPEGVECAGIAVIGYAGENKDKHGKVGEKFVFESTWKE
ncbi:nitroreductase family protein [Cloacibacillus sp. An23]|uniref:nitroreductase family protein n=1 Tax=Cloacibacillus sp. An23 TaxID=1965591 RepID=UPI000B38CB2D|nr:nitroreductase family protein [Cloacibacillus sp. An23]OUO93491.1 nitroreductase [Cloacibacillus sp. An23]